MAKSDDDRLTNHDGACLRAGALHGAVDRRRGRVGRRGERVLFTTSMPSTARRLRYTGQLHSAMQPSIDSPRSSPSTRRRRYFTPRQSVLPAPERDRTLASRKFDRGLGQILHDQLHWLDVPDRVLFKLAVTVHRCLNGRAPPYLSEHCIPVSSADTRRHLRSANRHLLAVPRFRLNTYGPMSVREQSRAAAGDVHRRLHMTRGPLKFWSDCKEVQRTCFL